MRYKPYKHQQETINLYDKEAKTYDASTMGVGKTFCCIADIVNKQTKALVLCPKSLVSSVWVNDIRKFAPHLTTATILAPDKSRVEGVESNADVYITNVDGVKWLDKNVTPAWYKQIDILIIDEATNFKNRMSGRSKALRKIAGLFKYRRLLSGTPTGGNVTDLWHQYYLLDEGTKYYGKSFTKFRDMTQISIQTGPQPNMVKWENRPGIEKSLAKIVEPVTIRHELTQVVDMPSRIVQSYKYKPLPKIIKTYNQLRKHGLVMLKEGTINAINAASLNTKLLQTLSGSVFNEDGDPILVDKQRYDLVLDLVESTEHSIVFFNWRHQSKYMQDCAKYRGVSFETIDGSRSNKERAEIVQNFQDGKYQTLFLQVQAASHGLTLTRADTTIWASPTYLADYYEQANARVFRIGQKKRTFTIHVEAEGTVEKKVYSALQDKLRSIDLLTEALT